ncbi:MAG: glycosyltransferase family 2 protein [Flavobacterium sp.]|nr:glycosyltransferase family 2 protein [Flavobacterium sp.]
MTYCVIIPAHNEEAFIGLTLDSLLAQTTLPSIIVVVDDHSTDGMPQILADFAANHPSIKVVSHLSDVEHLPGSKVIRAFQKGYDSLNESYDIIVKLDADLILPDNYFERIISEFESKPRAGIVGGFAYIEKDGNWVLENLTDKDHIRGAFKAYRRGCFDDIGALKPAMGWDTVDELLAKFRGWEVVTLSDLKVKHLKPTGKNYNKSARFKQGEAFYTLGYGFWIALIASAKLALMKKSPLLFFDYVRGFLKAKSAKTPMLVTPEQASFIKSYRLAKMRSKIF